jgi:formate hydrogenlyase subunit 3/multisubunit Na+/H+ antiporter MnhD subunit
MPASAVLSGAIVKAGVIGLLRFLPVEGTEAGWSLALGAIGGATAFWGIGCGLTQRNPKTVLAYSTVSQMGFAVAALGLGLAAGDPATPMAVSFYAAHHVLAKGGLFLALGVAARCGGGPRGLLLVLLPALVLGLGFAGLPPTGGALAKAATKPLFGEGAAALLAALAATGSTLLMLHFAGLLSAALGRGEGTGRPPMALLLPWLGIALLAVLLPWARYAPSGLGDPLATLSVAELWKALWPVLLGAALLPVLRRWGARLPPVPEGDLLHPVQRLLGAARGLGAAIARVEAALTAWPAAGLALLLLAAAFGAALLAPPR